MAAKKPKQRGLGRGLSALMADVSDAQTENTPETAAAELNLPIEKVVPNPEQPRRRFDEEKLADLASSIREKGVIQPIIVRQSGRKPDEYEIVAGERRWRAAQLAKLHHIPVLVRDFSDIEVLEVAIIENIQRADLNPMEEALGYSQLMEKFGHTQEKLSEVLGKSRSHIANTVRLAQLPEIIQEYLRTEQLSAGHARALITAEDPVELAQQVIKKGLSVRQTEKLAKAGVSNVFSETGKSKIGKMKAKDADTRALEGDLSAGLGMKVSIDHDTTQESGVISVRYNSLDELDTLCGILSATK